MKWIQKGILYPLPLYTCFFLCVYSISYPKPSSMCLKYGLSCLSQPFDSRQRLNSWVNFCNIYLFWPHYTTAVPSQYSKILQSYIVLSTFFWKAQRVNFQPNYIRARKFWGSDLLGLKSLEKEGNTFTLYLLNWGDSGY